MMESCISEHNYTFIKVGSICHAATMAKLCSMSMLRCFHVLPKSGWACALCSAGLSEQLSGLFSCVHVSMFCSYLTLVQGGTLDRSIWSTSLPSCFLALSSLLVVGHFWHAKFKKIGLFSSYLGIICSISKYIVAVLLTCVCLATT